MKNPISNPCLSRRRYPVQAKTKQHKLIAIQTFDEGAGVSASCSRSFSTSDVDFSFAELGRAVLVSMVEVSGFVALEAHYSIENPGLDK